MPFDPSGNFTRVMNWQQDRDNGIRILADRHDAEDDNFANAFNQVFLRGGIVPMTGDLNMGGYNINTIKAGSAPAPSLTWELDPDTGFFQPNPTSIGFSINGVQKLGFNPSGLQTYGGDILIGHTNAAAVGMWNDDFSVKYGYVSHDGTNLIVNNLLNGATQFFVNGAERARIAPDGKVGIGTTNPAYALDVNFRAIFGPPAATPGVAGYVMFRDDTATPRWLAGILGSIGNQNFSIRDLVADRNTIQITNAGRVGISIDDPQQPLEVSTAIGIRATSPVLAFYNATGAARLGYLNHDGLSLVFATEVAGGALKFNTSGIERVRVTDTGRVGVPIPLPRGRLHVLADGPATAWQDTSKTLILGEESGNTQYGMQLGMFINPGGAWVGGIQQISAGGPSILVLNPGGGEVGIGNDQPGFLLDCKSTYPAVRCYNVNNNCSMLIESASNGGNVGTTSGSNLYFCTGGGQRMILTANGDGLYPNSTGTMNLGGAGNAWGTIYAANPAIQPSDQRLKTPLTVLTSQELAAAKAIAQSIGSYQWLDTAKRGGDIHIGVIAQAVIAAMEEQGLDALSYGFVQYSEWGAVEPIEGVEEAPATFDTETHEVVTEAVRFVASSPGREAGNEYSVAYTELAMFIVAAQEQRLATLEAMLVP